MAGEVLKKKREDLGLDIRAVSELLKLKAEYLSSIEEDKFEKLPVAVYTIGYIRCYASYLQVDPEPIIAYYTGHLSHPGPSTIIPVASSKKTVPFYYYVIPLFIFLLIVIGVFIMRQGRTTAPHMKAASDHRLPVQVEMPRQTAPLQEASAPTPVTVPPTISQPNVQAKIMPGQVHRLEVTANDLTWVQITFSQGGTEETLLRPGLMKVWEFPDKAMLKLGNAGGVRLHLDGKDIGVPGSNGQVMTISLPENRPIPRQASPPRE